MQLAHVSLAEHTAHTENARAMKLRDLFNEMSHREVGSVSRDGHLAGNKSLQKAPLAALLVPRYMDRPMIPEPIKEGSNAGFQAFIASDTCTTKVEVPARP
ncbi:hypothetical protein BDZ89DRAFT_1041339 [Hymenopellis radicata]|nr:hypothetical protein BDZ89DRAFT_1041339 [Hymenopellis radicata]